MPQDSVATVENFWREVWKQPQNPEAIDRLVHEDFVITSGGRDIVGREAFKVWVKDFQARVHDFEFHVIETFQNQDGSRVASRWRVTGRNNGLMGTEPNDAPFEMSGTAVSEVGANGLLRHNWVERNAFEVCGATGRTAGTTSSETVWTYSQADKSGPYLSLCGRTGGAGRHQAGDNAVTLTRRSVSTHVLVAVGFWPQTGRRPDPAARTIRPPSAHDGALQPRGRGARRPPPGSL